MEKKKLLLVKDMITQLIPLQKPEPLDDDLHKERGEMGKNWGWEREYPT